MNDFLYFSKNPLPNIDLKPDHKSAEKKKIQTHSKNYTANYKATDHAIILPIQQQENIDGTNDPVKKIFYSDPYYTMWNNSPENPENII